MVIYMLHKDRITTFELPKEVSGSYILSDDQNIEKLNLINIEGIDGSWVAYSNADFKIFVNQKIEEQVVLQPYNFYQLILYGSDSLVFYTCPGYESSLNLMQISNNSFVVGNDVKCDICYNHPSILQQQIQFESKDNSFYFKNLNVKVPIYVNFVRKDEGYLSNFDSIFVMGLKIIIFGNYILINNPLNLVTLNTISFLQPSINYVIPNYETNGIIYKDFYSDKDYFTKSPVFQNEFNKATIEIASPPALEKQENNSILMEIIPSVLMSLTSMLTVYYSIKNYSTGETDKENFIMTIAMAGVMLVTGIVWPFIQRFYMNTKNTMELRRNRKSYVKYLKNKKEEINKLRLKQQVFLKNSYLDLKDCVLAIVKKNAYLFSRSVDNKDFLTIRLGIGKINFDAHFVHEKPEYSLKVNKLYEEIDKLIEEEKYIDDVPVVVSLKEYNVISFLNENISKYEYIKSILLQIVALHSFVDLKIILFTDSIGVQELSAFKNLNHFWDNNKSMRFFTSDINEAQDISTYLENIFIERSKTSDDDKKQSMHRNEQYLIISDNISLYRNLNIINDILESDKNYGFSLMVFDEKISNVPEKCKFFVNYNATSATCFEKVMKEDGIINFKPEFSTSFDKNIDVSFVLSLLANIPMKVDEQVSGNLPTNLGFLEMNGVGRVEQINIEERWKTSAVVNSLAAPVGVDTNGNLITLDLHEKRHGPHGLVAGMTGSGKSEFIVTYILSLAINYNPYEVQFVLIDYKGGGLAGAFENRQTGVKLPHLVGTITNLDKSEMNRTLVSIQSELQRRQKKFNEVKETLNIGTIDIYKYQKLYREGKIEEPMSHLFIISDEFAELKAQQPDFMDQLVSAARIGRSLGIHLILATQKPSGVVDEQIWSNSKFKVCCKVQTAEDSREMLGKPDAAFLKDSGRFYLQVGYDLYYVLGQSAYSGAAYVPSNKIVSKVDNSVSFVNNIGEVIKTIDEIEDEKEQEAVTEDLGEELSNIIKHIISVSEKNNFNPRKLWLDNIPSSIYIENIKNKYKDEYKVEKNIINPPIGEYDDPEHQSQGLVTLPITTEGHCYIAGVAGSGKSTFLSTLIFSTIVLHSADEVNFYIIDFGRENLKKFAKAPQVCDVLTAEDPEKIEILFNRISYEIKRRKDVLSELDLDFISYCKKGDLDPLPNIIVIINGYDSFSEQFEELIDEKFSSILREASKFGIYLVIAGTAPNSISYSYLNYFTQKVGLKFNDPMLYDELLSTNLVPADNPGRGLIGVNSNVFQFQTCLILPEDSLNQNLNKVFDSLNECFPNKAQPIPTMPDIVSSQNFIESSYDLDCVPVGYNIFTINPATFNFDNLLNIILTSKERTLLKFVKGLANLMVNIPNNKVIVMDGKKEFSKVANDKVKYYDSNFSKLIKFLYDNMLKFEEKDSYAERITIFIFGYETIKKHLSEYYSSGETSNDEDNITLDDLILRAKDSKLFKFVICGRYNSTSLFENEKWFNFCPNKTGIYLGTDLSDQDFLIGKRIDGEYKLNLDSNNAIIVDNMIKTFINYISD